MRNIDSEKMNSDKAKPDKKMPENAKPNKAKPDKKKKRKKKRHFRMPRLSRVIYLIFLILTVVFVSNRGGAISYALFYAALIYPVLAILYLLISRAAIRIYQDLPVREMKKNLDEPYTLLIENSGFFPIAGITLYTYGERSSFGEEIDGMQISLIPKEKREISTTFSCRYAGSYEAGIERLSFTDCFGLFTLKLKTPAPLYVQVLPVVNPETAQDAVKAVLELTSGTSGGRMKEQESILGNDLRTYVPGDPLKRIHWKNYARSGELFVRLPEEKDLALVSVVLRTRPMEVDPRKTEKPDPEKLRAWQEKRLMERDLFLTMAVSVAAYFAEQKRPVQFFYYNAGIMRTLVEDYEGLTGLCQELSRALVLRGDTEGVDILLALEAERWRCPVMTLTEESEPWQEDDEGISKWEVSSPGQAGAFGA